MNKENPVICAECSNFDTWTYGLENPKPICELTHRRIYNSKPDWCPKPLWGDQEETNKQMNLFDEDTEREDGK